MWSNSSEGAKSQKQRPYSKSRPTSLLERMNHPIRSSSVPYPPILASSTTSSGLLERISPRKGLRPLKSEEPLQAPPQPQYQAPLLTPIQQSQNLRSSSFLPHPIAETPGDITQRTQSPRMQKRGRRRGTGPLSPPPLEGHLSIPSSQTQARTPAMPRPP